MLIELKSILRPYWVKVRIPIAHYRYKGKIKKLKNKNRVRVAFLLVNESIWKYEQLYFLFKNNPRYEPVVFICPFITYGEEIQKKEMENTFARFKKKDYIVIKTQNEDDTYIDINKNFEPDIVFFSTPWEHSLPQYHLRSFLNQLTCYVPYGFKSSNLFQYHFNMDMHNFCWKVFFETPVHKKLAKKHSLARGRNVVVTGFPGMDSLLNSASHSETNTWKPQERLKKKIIWAPHHTIQGSSSALDYSTFLEYYNFILHIANKYKDHIQLAFKPHPNLKGKLFEVWGEEETTKYYEKWKNLSNGQLEEGEYIDLFAQSDALIHDSGSFVIEYLYTSKPAMFLIGSEKVKSQFNEIGKEAINKLYNGYSKDHIEEFITDIVIDEEDFKEKERTLFFNKTVKPPYNLTASENIFNYIHSKL